MSKLDADKIKTAFREFAGDERYRKFVRAISQRCPEKGRLFFWQEQLWNEFSSAHPEDTTSQGEILRILRVCYIHNSDLAPMPPVDEPAAEFRRTPEYDQAVDNLFPLATGHFFYCPECHRERQEWMSEHAELCRVLGRQISFEAYCNEIIEDLSDDNAAAREAIKARMKPAVEKMAAEIAADTLPGDEIWEWDTGMYALSGAQGVAIVRDGKIVKKWCTARA